MSFTREWSTLLILLFTTLLCISSYNDKQSCNGQAAEIIRHLLAIPMTRFQIMGLCFKLMVCSSQCRASECYKVVRPEVKR